MEEVRQKDARFLHLRGILSRFFPELEDGQLTSLGEASQEVEFEKGDVVFSEGDRMSGMDWLVSGEVLLSKASVSGKKAMLHVVDAEHFLDQSLLFGDALAFVSAEALSPCSVVRIDIKALRDVLLANAPFAVRLMRAVAVRQRMFINKATASLGKVCVRRRVAGWLLHKARVRNSMRLEDRVTREVLAGMLGLTRESLSRQLAAFAEEGLVRLEKKAVIVLDMDGLLRCLKN